VTPPIPLLSVPTWRFVLAALLAPAFGLALNWIVARSSANYSGRDPYTAVWVGVGVAGTLAICALFAPLPMLIAILITFVLSGSAPAAGYERRWREEAGAGDERLDAANLRALAAERNLEQAELDLATLRDQVRALHAEPIA
jgi:hypothetical protein